jgi:methylated-DNA-protein-cysteine methyltransferase-like protein
VTGSVRIPYSQADFDTAVWRVVAAIAPGRVMSYGAVARAAGYPRHARMVGRSMGRAPKPLPWHRVVRADLTLAFAPGSTAYMEQKRRLGREGVAVQAGRAVPLERDSTEELDRLLWAPSGFRDGADGS